MNFLKTFLLVAVCSLAMGCMTGEMDLSEPQWNPPILAKDTCQNFDGRYTGQSLFQEFAQFAKWDYVRKQWRLDAAVTRASLKTLPYENKRVVFGEVRTIVDPNKEKIFEQYASTLIKQQGKIIEVFLVGDKGVLYSKVILNMTHKNVGCNKGRLMIRELSSHFGSELSKGTATAIEYEFYKLKDDSLQVVRKKRNWVGNMKEEPRRTEETQRFIVR